LIFAVQIFAISINGNGKIARSEKATFGLFGKMTKLASFLVVFLVTAQKPAPATDILSQAAQAEAAGKVAEAIRLYTNATREQPLNASNWCRLGSLYYHQKRFNESRETLRRCVSLDPNSSNNWAMLGLSEFESNDLDIALPHLQRALGSKEDTALLRKARLRAAMLLTRADSYDAALKLLMYVALKSESTPEILDAMGLAVLRQAKLPREVLEKDREMIRRSGQAVYHTASGHATEAQRQFEELAATYPAVPNIHYAFGTFLIESDPENAIVQWKREIEISPAHVPARLQIALAYLKRKDPESGLPYAEEAVRIAPKFFAGHNVLGRLLLEGGRPEKSIPELEIAIALEPRSPQAHFALASAYARIGRKEDAARERALFEKLTAGPGR